MPAARGSYSFLLRCALLDNRRALRAMHLALFTMLGPGGPGFPWEWDGFNGSPSGAATQSGVDMYPVSDGTPHAKQKVHGKLAPLSLASFLLHPSLAHQFVCKICLSPALSVPMSCRRMSLPALPWASLPRALLFIFSPAKLPTSTILHQWLHRRGTTTSRGAQHTAQRGR